MRHDQSGRPAVYRGEWLVVELVGDERLSLHHLVQRKVGGVPAVAVGHHVPGGWIDLDGLEQGVDAYAKPLGVELGPLRDATDVDGVRLAGEFLKLVPAPGPRSPDQCLGCERPAGAPRVRAR